MEKNQLILATSLQCKNCGQPINNRDKFCSNCSAKVISQRITVKNLFSEFATNVFGWDNKFFFTIRMLIQKPHVLFKEYLEGTRKKYMNPLSLLALGAAMALFIFNFFAEDYMALNLESNRQTVDIMSNMMQKQFGEGFDAVAYKADTMKGVTASSAFMLKYFNLLVILFLPFYTLLAFLTYRKPYNYGEHLVINSFILGISYFVTSIVFTISVFTNPSVYILTIVLLIFYYTYAYGKLHSLTIAESILKLMKFFGILVLSIVVTMILSFVIGLAAAYISN